MFENQLAIANLVLLLPCVAALSSTPREQAGKSTNMLQVDGPGLPVLFVHGAAGSAQVWSRQLDHLRSRHRAIAITLPGHGRTSDLRKGATALFTLSHDIETAVQELGISRFVLAGHSMGAYTIIEYARRHPEQVAGLLLVDPSGDYRRVPDKDKTATISQIRDPKQRLAFWKPILAGSAASTRKLVLADLKTTPEQTFRTLSAELFSYDPVTPLAHYSGLTLSVYSPCGEEPQALHNRIGSLPRHRMNGVSHWLMLDDPSRFNNIMDEFLKKVSHTDARP